MSKCIVSRKNHAFQIEYKDVMLEETKFSDLKRPLDHTGGKDEFLSN